MTELWGLVPDIVKMVLKDCIKFRIDPTTGNEDKYAYTKLPR